MIAELGILLQRTIGKRESEIADLAKLEGEMNTLTVELETLAHAQVILQEVATETQARLKLHLEELVQSAIDAVFPDQYKVHIDFLSKAGQTECDIYLMRGNDRIDPMDSSGGGVVDIVSFALRLVSWSIGTTENTIVLDEPFKFLSVGLRSLAGDLLRRLSHILGLQLIYVTHDPELVQVADRVFEISQKEGISSVKTIEGTPYDE